MSKVSIFKSVKDPSNPHNRDISYALKRIKEGNSENIVNQVRNLPDEKKNEAKILLPGVCFQGTFKYRSVDQLIQHSGFLIIDIDKLQVDVKKEKESLSKNEYIYSLWISPSGSGLKGLVRVPPEKENHKGYFQAFGKYLNHPNWDDSGSDVSRICYESYDPDIYINEDASVWSELEEPDIEDVGLTSENVVMPVKSENRIIDNIIVWWTKKYGMTKGEKNNNLFKLSAAFNDFGVSQSEAERECLKFDEGGKQKEILLIVKSAYKKTTQFGTKFFEDKDTIEKVEKLVRSGKKKTDIAKCIPDSKEFIENIKDNLDIDEYWYFDDKNKIRLQPHKYKFWLQQNNFFKFFPSQKSSTYSFIKRDRNLLEETDEKRIKDYVLTDIMERPNVGYTPYDFMAMNTAYFKSEFLSMIDSIDVEIMEDTKDKCYLYFKNCVVEVTKNSIKEIDYIDIDGYVWKRQIINRDFINFDHHKSEFRTFIWKIAGEDIDRYNTFKSVIGYLLHSYKNSANNKAIILNDETISEFPNGGSGKGLFWNALKHMKKVASIDGKTFEFNKAFPYQTLSTDTQILVFDDVKKSFNFENLFSLITEGITIEYKGQDAVTIPVEQSPKLLITTNYTIGGVGGSFERRKFEVELSDYFNYKNTPIDFFGHMLFGDWSNDEWQRFDNYMIQCVQYYLENGLVKSDYHNLETRKFIKETCFEFYQWVDDGNLNIDTRHYKTAVFNSFVEENTDFRRWLNQRRFTRWLKSYGKYKGFNILDSRDQNGKFIEYSDNSDIDSDKNDVPF